MSYPTNNDDERARNIVQGMGLLTLQNIATSVLGFFFLFAVIHLIPEFQYGVYSAVLVTVTITATIAGLGISFAAVRFVAYHNSDSESWDAAKKSLLLSLLVAGVTTALYVALSPEFSLYFTKNTSWTWAFILGGGWIFTATMATTFQGALQGLKKYSKLAKIIFLSRLIMVVVSISVLYFFRLLELALSAWVLFYGLICIWIFMSIGKPLLAAKGTYRFSTILRYSLPLGIAGIIGVVATSSDTVVVGGYLNPSLLGVYQAAISVSSVLSVVAVTPLITALFPEISSSRTIGDISNGVRLTFRFATIIVLPTTLLFAAVSPQLLSLFTSGGVYLAGTLTLELVALFYVFVAIQTMLLTLLQAVGKTTQVILVGVVTSLTDIGVALLLVPHFGLAGAVTSRVAVSLDGAAVCMYLSRSYMGNLDKRGFYLKGVISSFIPFAIILFLSTVLTSRLISLIPYTVLFALIYLVCIRQLHLLTKEDRAYLTHTLPRRLRKFVDYL